MRRRVTRVLYAAAAAGIALTSFSVAGAGAQAGAVAGSLSPPRYAAGVAGYTAEGRWFRFVSTTMTVPPRILPQTKHGTGDAIVQLGRDFMPTYPYANVVVHPGGGPGSIEVSADSPGAHGRSTLRLSPRVGDRLAVSIYYDRQEFIYFTVSDLTQHTAQTSQMPTGKVVYNRALLGGFAWGRYTPPQAGTRLWKFTGTRLTTYTGVHGTLTGPWDTTPWIDTTSDHGMGTVIASPSELWNGGANFGVWLRPVPHSYTNELAGYEIYGDLFRFATTTVTVPPRLPDSIAKGGAGVRAEIQLNSPAAYARIAVTPGGGSGSVTYRAATATHTDVGALKLNPAVGDQLKLSIYYDRKGHDVFTATDITQGTTKTARATVGSRNYRSVWVMGAIDNTKVKTPPSDIRLWKFTGTHLTTYNGIWHSTILGPWRADEFIDTPDATSSAPVMMSAPILWNGGQDFGVWLRNHQATSR
jgi:hypothetical protein